MIKIKRFTPTRTMLAFTDPSLSSREKGHVDMWLTFKQATQLWKELTKILLKKGILKR